MIYINMKPWQFSIVYYITHNKHSFLSHLYFKELSLQLDLRIGEPMQICIHRKENSPKPVNHRLTLKEGPKVKSNNIRRFPAHDFLRAGFTLQTSSINNKQVISTFRFGHPRLMLKEGLRRFPVDDFP